MIDNPDFNKNMKQIENMIEQIYKFRDYQSQQNKDIQELELYQQQIKRLSANMNGMIIKLNTFIRNQVNLDDIDVDSGWDINCIRK